MDVNKLTLIGRVATTPKLTAEAGGSRCATFTVATTYSWKEAGSKRSAPTTEEHHVVVYGKLADIVERYLKEGQRVYLEGRLTHPSDRPAELVADEVILLGQNKR